MFKKQMLLQAIFIGLVLSLSHGTATNQTNPTPKKHPNKEFIVIIEGGEKSAADAEKLLAQAATETEPLLKTGTNNYCKNTGLAIGAVTIYLIATAIVGGLVVGFFKFVQSQEP